mgnify:CR=1 FL=1
MRGIPPGIGRMPYDDVMTDPTADNDPRPVEPIEPDLNECCGNGCCPCVFDTYAEEKRSWQQALKAWEERHPDQVKDTATP